MTELVSAVGREWSHNVHRESVPRASGLDTTRGLLAMARGYDIPLWQGGLSLSHLNADAAASLVGVAVTKQLPQGLAV